MDHDDFKFEPIRGLPEALPAGEEILWQGRPKTMRLVRDAWKLNWILGYFAVLAIWRVGVSSTAFPMATALSHAVPFLVAAGITSALLIAVAAIQARSTVYTLTNKRVSMRIGAALTMTLNLPYVCIGSAQAATNRDGTGTIAFALTGTDRVSYLMTWPHVRPWHVNRTQPAFRAIPDAARIAQMFSEAAETRINEPQITRVSTNAIAAE